MKKILSLFFALIPALLTAQSFIPGWQGDKILPDGIFLDENKWTKNQSSLSLGDTCKVTTDTAFHLHWRFGTGSRGKFAQAYIVLDTPVDLSDKDVIGIDIRGESGKSFTRTVELKFESGSIQAVYTWENLAHLNRWADRLVILKNQFSNAQTMNWSAVHVISLAVTSNAADANDNLEDAGTVSFTNLVAQSIDSLSRVVEFDSLAMPSEELQVIAQNAINAIMGRQKSTGLLTTWAEDGSSWLYGQGLALKALTLRGSWDQNTAADEFAVSAGKLAHFLANHQESEGYWPRAWNSINGNILVKLEGDNTVWMGDFPWIAGSLAFYYRKSGDETVYPSILKAKGFLYDLIDPSGKVYTKNMVTGIKSEVSNYEGYAAALYALLQFGDTVKAGTVMQYVMNHGWNATYDIWKEGPGSLRPVLLVNVWLASLADYLGWHTEALKALSGAGHLLYTRGGGVSGFDGVGPISSWFEGTFSYISAGGPACDTLFKGLVSHLKPNGMAPAYNENLGAIGGIWAVDWASLDATSWLYYAASRQTPFVFSGSDPDVFTSNKPVKNEPSPIVWFEGDKLRIETGGMQFWGAFDIQIYSGTGKLAGSSHWIAGQQAVEIQKNTGFEPGIYIIVLRNNNSQFIYKVPIVIP